MRCIRKDCDNGAELIKEYEKAGMKYRIYRCPRCAAMFKRGEEMVQG